MKDGGFVPAVGSAFVRNENSKQSQRIPRLLNYTNVVFEIWRQRDGMRSQRPFDKDILILSRGIITLH